MSDGCSSGSVSAGIGAATTMGMQYMQAISPALTLGGKCYRLINLYIDIIWVL